MLNFVEVSVTSQESERSCISVKDISFVSFYHIPTVWYFLFVILFTVTDLTMIVVGLVSIKISLFWNSVDAFLMK